MKPDAVTKDNSIRLQQIIDLQGKYLYLNSMTFIWMTKVRLWSELQMQDEDSFLPS